MRNTSSIDLQGAHVVVTGATGGVGGALSREFARRGARVSLVARSKDALEDLAAKVGGTAFAADLSSPGDLADLGPRMSETNGPVDVLVNNAAVAVAGAIAEQSSGQIQTMVLTNLLGPIELTRQLLPAMLGRGRGAVINVSALAGEIALINTAVYGSTKAGITHFTHNLQRELRRTSVSAMVVVLGAVAGTTMNEDSLKDPVVAKIAARFDKMATLLPEDIAVQVVNALAAGKKTLVLPGSAGPAVKLRQLPSRVTDLLMRGVDA